MILHLYCLDVQAKAKMLMARSGSGVLQQRFRYRFVRPDVVGSGVVGPDSVDSDSVDSDSVDSDSVDSDSVDSDSVDSDSVGSDSVDSDSVDPDVVGSSNDPLAQGRHRVNSADTTSRYM